LNDDDTGLDDQAPDLVENLRRRREIVRTEMGGLAKVERIHAAGGRTARDWIDSLLDHGSFTEVGTFVRSENVEERPTTPGDSQIGGHGLVAGRPVTVLANDVTVKGGSGSRSSKRRQDRIYDQATRFGNPYILFGQAGGARVTNVIGSERMSQGEGIGKIAARNRCIPMVTAIVGRSYGDSSFAAACSDFVVQLRGTAMAVSSPRVIEIATAEVVSEEELGGVDVHAERTGQIDVVAETQDDVIAAARRFLSFMPDNGASLPPRMPSPTLRSAPELRSLVPTERRRGYDMRKLIAGIVDGGGFMELKPRFARSLITALARVDGWTVGILANQPMQQGGAMTPDTCDKAVSFITLCDSFHIPLIFLADTPGFLVGKQVEHSKLLHKAVMLNQALLQVGVPMLTFVIRKAYGLAYFAMAGGRVGSVYVCGWPSAEISFMDPDVGANVLYATALERLDGEARAAEAQRLASQVARATSAYDAAVSIGIDEVIDPADTPLMVAQALGRMMPRYDPKRERRLANWPTCL
jgi:acetyl-CoA carboxylase carboxyltransferase component